MIQGYYLIYEHIHDSIYHICIISADAYMRVVSDLMYDYSFDWDGDLEWSTW